MSNEKRVKALWPKIKVFSNKRKQTKVKWYLTKKLGWEEKTRKRRKYHTKPDTSDLKRQTKNHNEGTRQKKHYDCRPQTQLYAK